MTGESPGRHRILLVAPNLSTRMGGEALKALQIHGELKKMGFEVRQVAHARVRAEMDADFPELAIDYVADDWVQVALYRLRATPLLLLLNAWQLHRAAQRVARDFHPSIVHFTSPISPVLPYFRLREAPVVIGPLNGNVAHPPAFRDREPLVKKLSAMTLGPLQWLLGMSRGKRDALLLVAGGERTERALTLGGCRPERMIATLDCGVPDALFDRPTLVQAGVNTAFAFVGRLVAYKGCDLAIRAVAAAEHVSITLDVIGDGPERDGLERLAQALGVADRVRFLGWIKAGPALYDRFGDYRALILPSLAEANGIAFQEAMILGLPIVCVDWAGPQELLAEGEAILIAPTDEAGVVTAIGQAMATLAHDPAAANELAAAARRKALDLGFRWRDLLRRWVSVYDQAAAGRS